MFEDLVEGAGCLDLDESIRVVGDTKEDLLDGILDDTGIFKIHVSIRDEYIHCSGP